MDAVRAKKTSRIQEENSPSDPPVSKTLVITLDDEPLISAIIEKILDVQSVSVSNFAQLRLALQIHHPSAVFVDIHLGLNVCGLDAIPLIRSLHPLVPIIVLTGDPSDESVVRALAAGANDFIKKPIGSKELLARYQARVEEYYEKLGLKQIEFGGIQIQLSMKQIIGPKGTRILTQTELSILVLLVQNYPKMVSKETLKSNCWGPVHVSSNAVDRKLYELRVALGAVTDGIKIRAAYGQGVCLELSV